MGSDYDQDAEDGRFLSETENDRHMSVVFIGHDLKDKFFPGATAIGPVDYPGGIPFQVVGVAKAKGSVFGQSQDTRHHSHRDYFRFGARERDQFRRYCHRSRTPAAGAGKDACAASRLNAASSVLRLTTTFSMLNVDGAGSISGIS